MFSSSTTTDCLVFIESQAHALWVKTSFPIDINTKFVAVTAEALEALEVYGIPHEAVCSYANSRNLLTVSEQMVQETNRFAREIETFIASEYKGARFDGPGLLSGNIYSLQYSVGIILLRAFLMRETIYAYRPKRIIVPRDDVIPWFAGDGYPANPWIQVVRSLAVAQGIQLDVVTWKETQSSVTPLDKHLRPTMAQFMTRAWGSVGRIWPQLPWLLSQRSKKNGSYRGLRLLIADDAGYDWKSVLMAMWITGGSSCFSLDLQKLDARNWTSYFSPSVKNLWRARTQNLSVGSFHEDVAEKRRLSKAFDGWLNDCSETPRLSFLGIDIFPALVPHLRAMTMLGPALIRHTDEVARQAIEFVRPHAVTFFCIPDLSTQRLAFQCQQQGIPTVCWQHGGGYGTHIAPKNDGMEPACADYFLTYGPGIKPRPAPAFPRRASYVPMGSTRIASMVYRASRRVSRPQNIDRILWVGEFSSHNLAGCMGQIEDTERFILEKRCLEILLMGHSSLQIIYRPYMHQVSFDGTSLWVKRQDSPRLSVDAGKPMEELISNSDVVITNTSVNTVWDEVLALRKPMILYCDPKQTPLMPHYAKALDRACCWCRSKDDMVDAIRKLACIDNSFITELKKHDPTEYLRNFVLNGASAPSDIVARALSFLNDVCRSGRSIDE